MLRYTSQNKAAASATRATRAQFTRPHNWRIATYAAPLRPKRRATPCKSYAKAIAGMALTKAQFARRMAFCAARLQAGKPAPWHPA